MPSPFQPARKLSERVFAFHSTLAATGGNGIAASGRAGPGTRATDQIFELDGATGAAAQ